MGMRGGGAPVRSTVRDTQPEIRRMPDSARRKPALPGGAAWHASATILALLGLADTIVTQIIFSAYAVSGVGASKVAAPPPLVAVSLIASALVGLLLALDQWRDSQRPAEKRHNPGSIWKRLRAHLAPPRAVGQRWSLRLRAAGAALYTTLAAVRREGIHLSVRGWIGIWLTALALGVSLAADIGAVSPASRPAAQWAWIASVVLLIASATFASLSPRKRAAGMRFQSPHASRTRSPGVRSDGILIAILVAGALALRLPHLTELPYVIHGDEAWCGLEALRWLNGGVSSLLSTGWYGLPVAGYGLPALVMRFAGASLWGLRLSSVLVGTLSIVLLYALAREFTSRRVAFVAAALLTVSHLHIEFSRTGIHYIYGMTAVLLVLWLLARALRRGSAIYAVLAAAAMSFSLQVYFSARIVFVIVPLFLLGLALLRRTGPPAKHAVQAWKRTIGWLALGLIVAVGPLAVYFFQDIGALTGRSAEVLILNLTPYRQHTLQAQFGTMDLRVILGRQFAAVPLIPGGLTDQTLQYGPRFAMLDPLIAALVLIGFWYAVCTLRRPLSLLLVLWVLGVVIFGGVLTIDLPSWPRLLAMLPALCLLAALALERLLRLVAHTASSAAHVAPLERLRWRVACWTAQRRWAMPAPLARRGGPILRTALGVVAVLAVVGFSLSRTLQHYFVQYPRSVNTDVYRTRYTDLAYYMALLPGWTHVILYDTGDLLLDYSTVRFLAPSLRGITVRTPVALRQALARRTGPVLIIVSPASLTTLQQALAKSGAPLPGVVRPVHNDFGMTIFYTYSIP